MDKYKGTASLHNLQPRSYQSPSREALGPNAPVYPVKDTRLCNTPWGLHVPDVCLSHPLKEASTHLIEITLH